MEIETACVAVAGALLGRSDENGVLQRQDYRVARGLADCEAATPDPSKSPVAEKLDGGSRRLPPYSVYGDDPRTAILQIAEADAKARGLWNTDCQAIIRLAKIRMESQWLMSVLDGLSAQRLDVEPKCLAANAMQDAIIDLVWLYARLATSIAEAEGLGVYGIDEGGLPESDDVRNLLRVITVRERLVERKTKGVAVSWDNRRLQ